MAKPVYDVDPDAKPIELNKDSGLDPNQHDPLKEGSFVEKLVNKNVDKAIAITGVVDTVLVTALFGLGAGVVVAGAYQLLRHIIGRWDVNIFKLFTDPLGFFGGSFFRSTRYFHYFNQFSLEQSDYLPDPINTYAAAAVAQNTDIGSYVVDSIQHGKGNNLKRYYQYSTIRFGNRNWDWRLDRAKDVDRSALRITNNLLRVLTPMPTRFEIIHQDTEFKQFGMSYLHWVQTTYGLDEFHKSYNGKSYEVLQPPVQQGDKWAIAQAEDGTYLTVDTIPVKPSKGITYWTNSERPKNLQVEKDYATETLVEKDIPANYPRAEDDIGVRTWVSEAYKWTNPYGKKAAKVNEKDSTSGSLSGALIYTKYVTLKAINKPADKHEATTYEYQVMIVVSYLGYDIEKFFYIEEDGSTNNPDLIEVMKEEKPKPSTKPVLASNTSKVFKFYPYIPLREWTKGRHAKYYDLPIVPEKFTKAVKTLNELAKEDEYEKREPYVAKNKKRVEKHKRNESKKTKDDETAKTISRKVQRGLASKRKVKARQLQHMRKPMSNEALKRHINQMAKLLNVDFDYEAVNFSASDYFEGDYYKTGRYASQLLMPGVNFASNNKETHHYLYTFFNRLYNLYGRQEQVKNWYATVQSATDLTQIQVNKLEWVNQSTMDYGGMSWLYINKFKMQGNIRRIRRSHRYYDILRGKPVTINNIEELQALIEPFRELATDKYHKTKNGIEYCIGGQEYNGNGIYENGNSVSEAFRNFDYTFIAKQVSPTELSVIAIAGLSFTTKLSEQTRWCRAFHDLGLHYERNRQKYVEGKANPNSTDEISRKESKKHHHYNVISHWGILPLDYRTLCKMGGTELERFAQRSLLHYGFMRTERKGKRKGLKPVMIVAQVVLFVVSLILALPSGGSSLTLNVVAQAVVQAVVTAVVVNLAVRYVLVPLLKAIGLTGIIAMIVLIVVAIAASMLGGSPPDSQSVLPYASEVGKQTATQVTSQLAQQTTQQTLIDTVKEAAIQGVTEAFNTSFKVVSTMLTAGTQAMNEMNQSAMQDIQKQAEQEQERYNKAATNLREQQEEMAKYAPNFDVKEVMSNLRLRFKMYNPDSFLTANSMPDEYSASYEYIQNFFDMKLNLDPETFDPVRSLDFSFNTLS